MADTILAEPTLNRLVEDVGAIIARSSRRVRPWREKRTKEFSEIVLWTQLGIEVAA